MESYFDFVIIGGGIAGVACAETLCELIQPSRFTGAGVREQISSCDAKVALVSATPTVKTTINLHRITNMIESFDVAETSGDNWSKTWPGTLTVFHDTVDSLDSQEHLVHLRSRTLRYGRICLSTGGIPRKIDPVNPHVIALRDTESLADFQKRLKDARRLVLIGNGGIATEIAHEVHNCQIIWAIKDASISTPFLDPAAAKFLLRARTASLSTETAQAGPTSSGDLPGPIQIRRMRYVVSSEPTKEQLVLVPADSDHETQKPPSSSVPGVAVGPDWAHNREFYGSLADVDRGHSLKVVYNVRVKRVLDPNALQSADLKSSEPFTESELDATDRSWPVYVELTNGDVYGCDLVISAIGVEANFRPSQSPLTGMKSTFFTVPFDTAPPSAGGGVLVDDQLQTSVADVYAAGDCAYANWTWAPHWFQMRLWNQARQMGFQAAKSMFGHSRGEKEVPLDFSFELFTHVTYFFGFKIVLLGLFNGQGLDLTSPDCYLLMRITPGREYVKCVMQSGRIQGALLIGETDLEETLENLIVNQLDLTNVENSLLDPDVDLSDYFD